MAAPDGRTLLGEWSGECEIPFGYLIDVGGAALTHVFAPYPVAALGWTADGLARVRLLKPIHASATRVRYRSGIYLLSRVGRVVRLVRATPPARGC
jgi:hypothetical protein